MMLASRTWSRGLARQSFGTIYANRRCALATSLRKQSTLSVVKPDPKAQRQAPTPIVFLAAARFGDAGETKRKAEDLWRSQIEVSARKGFECLLLDLSPDFEPEATTRSMFEQYEKEMAATLRKAATFPPILFCRGAGSLIGEQYASSHPLTALLLVDPPVSVQQARQDHPHLFPSEPGAEGDLSEFDFEAKFDCMVAWSRQELERVQRQGSGETDGEQMHRIERDLIEWEEQDGRIVFDDVDAAEAVEEVHRWLDEECGV